MKEWRFTVPGPMSGLKSALEFMERVRKQAAAARVPKLLGLNGIYHVTIEPRWKGRAKVDLSDMVEMVLTALCENRRQITRIVAVSTEIWESEECEVKLEKII